MNGKNFLCASLFGMFMLAIVFSGCEKNDDEKDNSVKSVVGTWKYVKHENIYDGGVREVDEPSNVWLFSFQEDGTYEEYNANTPSFRMSGTYVLDSDTLSLLRNEKTEQYAVALGNNGQMLEMRWTIVGGDIDSEEAKTTLCISYYEKQ